tara:strand:+ start:4207 stop:4389 length:183 start_codon:yes stop_codon:yes gene_type:complete
MTEEENTPLPDIFGLTRLEDKLIDMPCFLGGKMTLDEFDDMATHYIQSYLYREQWLQNTN